MNKSGESILCKKGAEDTRMQEILLPMAKPSPPPLLPMLLQDPLILISMALV